MSLARALRQAAGLAAIHDAPASGRMLAGACLQQLRGLSAATAPSNQMQLIKQLREQTGAPIGDVKTALQSANWDLGEVERSHTYPSIAPLAFAAPPSMAGRRRRRRRRLPAAAPSSSTALSPVALAVRRGSHRRAAQAGAGGSQQEGLAACGRRLGGPCPRRRRGGSSGGGVWPLGRRSSFAPLLLAASNHILSCH